MPCTNDNPIFRLLFFVFMYSGLVTEICCAGVPFEAPVQPMPGFALDSCEIVMPGNSQPHPPYLDVYYIFPATLGFNPKILIAIKKMQWEGNLYFEYQNVTQTTTDVLIRLTKYPNVSTTTQNIYLLRFNLFLCEDTHYKFIIDDFLYNTSVTTIVPQSFSLSVSAGQIAILTGYQDLTDSNFIPGSAPNIFSSGVTISFDNNNGLNGYMIITLLYKVVQISHSLMYDMNTFYVTRASLYTCDLSSACAGTLMFFETVFPNKFFDGVMGFTAMSSISQNATFSFNLTSPALISMSNVHVFIFQYTLLYQICPYTSKYFSARHLQCWSQCPDTTYLMPPSTTAPLSYFKYYCDICATYCLTCNLVAGNCTSCFGQNRFFLTNATLNTHVCLCPFGQYGTPPACSNCNHTMLFCVYCDSGINCLECDGGLIFNPVSNMCECPPSLEPVLNNFTYIDSNNATITVAKLRCISKRIVESCIDSVLTSLMPVDMNIFPYGQTCSCITGGEFIQNKCI